MKIARFQIQGSVQKRWHTKRHNLATIMQMHINVKQDHKGKIGEKIVYIGLLNLDIYFANDELYFLK